MTFEGELPLSKKRQGTRAPSPRVVRRPAGMQAMGPELYRQIEEAVQALSRPSQPRPT